MSSLRQLHKYCCENLDLIENFKVASVNLRVWDCHHRLEDKGYSRQQLIDAGIYWHRPANELILLRHNDHAQHHNKGKNNPNFGKTFTAEHKKRLSISHTGERNQNFGKPHSAEWNKKIGDSQRGEKGFWFGKKRSKADCQKISQGHFARWESHTTARVIEIKRKLAHNEELTKADYCFRSKHKQLF